MIQLNIFKYDEILSKSYLFLENSISDVKYPIDNPSKLFILLCSLEPDFSALIIPNKLFFIFEIEVHFKCMFADIFHIAFYRDADTTFWIDLKKSLFGQNVLITRWILPIRFVLILSIRDLSKNMSLLYVKMVKHKQ